MGKKRSELINERNEDLARAYLNLYAERNQLHGAYNNYASILLDWSFGKDILTAPKFDKNLETYLKERQEKTGKIFTENYTYSISLFIRDFFRFCISELPEFETSCLTEEWIDSIVIQRSSSERTEFDWLTDKDIERILDFKTDNKRLLRTKAAVLFSVVTGASRAAVMTIPISEINFKRLIVNQDPAKGVYTEKLISRKTKMINDQQILSFLEEYTNSLTKFVPKNSAWFMRYSKNGHPLPYFPAAINEENRPLLYKKAISSYSKLRDDLIQLAELCEILKMSMTTAQNTYIYKRLKSDSSKKNMKDIAFDMLMKDTTPIRVCYRLMHRYIAS